MSVEMSVERTAQVEMLIRFFNMQAGTSYKVSNDKNRETVVQAIERANGDIVKLKNYIRNYANGGNRNISDCFDAFEVEEVKEEKVEEQPM